MVPQTCRSPTPARPCPTGTARGAGVGVDDDDGGVALRDCQDVGGAGG